MIYNTVLGVQQSDSVTCVFPILFHYIECSSLCYAVNPCLSILYIVMCICQSHTPDLSPIPPLVTASLFSMSVSLFLFCK